ncbi:type VI secretion system lipoprotein TssJ [Acidocella sp.]|uniref:type VI secretion system lipoprotein TssJ n=1 Tax=Acidocella sp. TaxID=50710 RepID=UPI00262EE52E|nr:type VI secretion system lipoprotein TssJ [Acidocella sp.]
MTVSKIFAAAAILLLAGCAAPPPPPPPPVLALSITGSAAQNPDAAGHGNAVAVALYQLTGTGRFMAADVYSLTGKEAATLGTDEAGGAQQFLLAPGQSLTETVSLKPSVTAVGFAVLFRDINHSTWKLVAPVAANGTTALSLHINGLVATLGK